jgi:AcrR family transcriptional regulator
MPMLVSMVPQSNEPTEAHRIALRAQDLFFRNGFSRVTTEEIARELGISKKTLYLHFASKEDLLRASLALMREDIQTAVRRIVADRRRDVAEKLHDLLVAVASRMSRIQRPFLEDLPRKAPELWQEIEEFRQRVVFDEVATLINQGSRRGMIRRDVDPQLFVLMFMATMRSVLTPETIASVSASASDVFQMMMRVFMQGVLTDEARARFTSEVTS